MSFSAFSISFSFIVTFPFYYWWILLDSWSHLSCWSALCSSSLPSITIRSYLFIIIAGLSPLSSVSFLVLNLFLPNFFSVFSIHLSFFLMEVSDLFLCLLLFPCCYLIHQYVAGDSSFPRPMCRQLLWKKKKHRKSVYLRQDVNHSLHFARHILPRNSFIASITCAFVTPLSPNSAIHSFQVLLSRVPQEHLHHPYPLWHSSNEQWSFRLFA